MSLVKATSTPLSQARYGLASASIGDYALFGGGYGGNYSAVVDVYGPPIAKMRLELPIGTKYKFMEHMNEQISEQSSILVNSPATGYIKYKKGMIS